MHANNGERAERQKAEGIRQSQGGQRGMGSAKWGVKGGSRNSEGGTGLNRRGRKRDAEETQRAVATVFENGENGEKREINGWKTVSKRRNTVGGICFTADDAETTRRNTDCRFQSAECRFGMWRIGAAGKFGNWGPIGESN